VCAPAAPPLHPAHFVDLLLYLQGLQVVKLGLVRLEFREVPELKGVAVQRGVGTHVRVPRMLHGLCGKDAQCELHEQVA
jgi:hypothetical protein